MLTTQQSISKILDGIRKGLITDMNDKNMKASGRTEKSLRVLANNEDGELYGVKSIGALVNGRGPTKSGSGSPTLQEAIFDWIQDKGIQPDTGTQEGLSWAISKSIHKRGTKAFRNESPKLDFKGIVELEISKGKKDLAKSIASIVSSQLATQLKQSLQ